MEHSMIVAFVGVLALLAGPVWLDAVFEAMDAKGVVGVLSQLCVAAVFEVMDVCHAQHWKVEVSEQLWLPEGVEYGRLLVNPSL